ncbi:hypothetical protein SD81_032670 [Tolypothrix campylonemoides VB511288]|nr:hypothetical protein SD81_032670 [Tolypothrix campylonemoides VB511288]
MQVRQYAQHNNLEVQQVLNFLKTSSSSKNWTITSKLTSEQEQTLNAEFGLLETPALPPQEEPKALPQGQTEQLQPQPQPQPQEEQQPITPAPIQTTSNNDVALTQSDLAAIATIRETFGEQGVQVFLQRKRQELVVSKATTDALRQHDEQKLYAEVKLQVENQLRLRDFIQEQQSLEMAITQHAQLKAQRKEQTQKLNEAFDAQLTELLNKQQDFNTTIELLGLSML